MKRIIMHIDKLVLRGIDHADAAAVSAGVQADLQRLLAEPGAASPLTGGGHRYRITAGTVHVTHGTRGRAMGHAIAGSIVKEVGA